MARDPVAADRRAGGKRRARPAGRLRPQQTPRLLDRVLAARQSQQLRDAGHVQAQRAELIRVRGKNIAFARIIGLHKTPARHVGIFIDRQNDVLGFGEPFVDALFNHPLFGGSRVLGSSDEW